MAKDIVMSVEKRKMVQVKIAFLRECNSTLSKYLDAIKHGQGVPDNHFDRIIRNIEKVSGQINHHMENKGEK